MAHPHSVPAVPAQGSDEALLAVAVGIACLVVVAVCDVYDALVSPLVCRDAWPAERALSLLRDESGTAFDHACVAALERVLEGAETPAAADAAAAVPVPA